MLLGVVPMQNKVGVAEALVVVLSALECPRFRETFVDRGTTGSLPV